MSYKDYSEKVAKDPIRKVQTSPEDPSSTFTKSIFDDFLMTLKSGDIHAKKSQKEIKEIKKIFIDRRPSKEKSPVYKSTPTNFHIRNMIVESV